MKKILLLPPDTPHPSYIDTVLNSLSFLHRHYEIHALDSLTIMEHLSNDAFYGAWQNKLQDLITQYDAFFGFSFGGVILQHCFSAFADYNKPVVLFSTPSFADQDLKQKLNKVISLCKETKVAQALETLYQYVYLPHDMPTQKHQHLNNEQAAKRVIFGLERVLNTDSRPILKHNEFNHWHLIGDISQLVNQHNVVAPKTGQLITVPKAGMRMLRDNPDFCQKVLLEILHHDR